MNIEVASTYARITVVDESLTQFLIAERVSGGWQSGIMHYPDAQVTSATSVHVGATSAAKAWDEGMSAGYRWALIEGPWQEPLEVAPANPYRPTP